MKNIRFVPSRPLLCAISESIQKHWTDQKSVNVYREAEAIRQSLSENVALEDIVDAFFTYGARSGVVFEINPQDAVHTLLGSSRSILLMDERALDWARHTAASHGSQPLDAVLRTSQALAATPSEGT